MRMPTRALVLVLLGSLAGSFAFAAAAQDKPAADPKPPAAAAPMPADQVERVWAASWKELSHFYIEWKGEYYSFPDYHKDYPSSLLVASRRVSEKAYAASPAASLTQTYLDENGIERKRTLKKEAGEIAAVKALPETTAGSYGWIHSGRVERVQGDDTIVLRQVQLVDAEEYRDKREKTREKLITQDIADYDAKVRANARPRQRNEGRNLIEQYRNTQIEAFRWWFAEREKLEERQRGGEYQFWEWEVVGCKTAKVAVGARWPSADKGIQLAVLEVKDRTIVAAPAAFLEKGLTEKEMVGLLEKVGLDKASFAVLVKEAKKRDEKGWIALVMHAIENEGKLPEPPKKAAEPAKKPAAKPAGKGDDVEFVK